jgi:hypothetical protein
MTGFTTATLSYLVATEPSPILAAAFTSDLAIVQFRTGAFEDGHEDQVC